MADRRTTAMLRGVRVSRLGVLLVLAVAACGDDDDGDGGPCGGDALAQALAAASAGDTVEVGACRIEGAFTVPAGVTLAGAGPAESILVGPAGGVALTLEPGEIATTARGLRVEAPDGCAAIAARGGGAGSVALEDVGVVVARGIGIGLEGLAGATLFRVDVRGGLAPEDTDLASPPLPPYTCENATPATHGLAAVEVAEATLQDVTIAGFAAVEALLLDGATTWVGGGATDFVGTGIEVWGGTATLTDLSIVRARDGMAPIESYGVVLAGGAEVDTSGLVVEQGDSIGVFCDAAVTTHESLQVTNNGFAGVWAQNVTGFSLTGESSRIAGNGFAGVAIVDSSGAVLRDARIESTVEKLGLAGPSATVRAADGVHVVRSAVDLGDLALASNARVGLLLELGGGSTEDASIEGVVVEAEGEALGAIAQNGDVVAGWDDGVTRQGATAVNDPLFADTLGVASGVGPSCIPEPGELAIDGLAGLLGR